MEISNNFLQSKNIEAEIKSTVKKEENLFGINLASNETYIDMETGKEITPEKPHSKIQEFDLWPKPVDGNVKAEVYTEEDLQKLISEMQKEADKMTAEMNKKAAKKDIEQENNTKKTTKKSKEKGLKTQKKNKKPKILLSDNKNDFGKFKFENDFIISQDWNTLIKNNHRQEKWYTTDV